MATHDSFIKANRAAVNRLKLPSCMQAQLSFFNKITFGTESNPLWLISAFIFISVNQLLTVISSGLDENVGIKYLSNTQSHNSPQQAKEKKINQTRHKNNR